jgi:hypothetical protein
MELTQEEITELNDYPNGSKFILLYEEELARVKELQAQIQTYDANLEKIKAIAEPWQKQQDEKIEAELAPIQVISLKLYFGGRRFFSASKRIYF